MIATLGRSAEFGLERRKIRYPHELLEAIGLAL